MDTLRAFRWILVPAMSGSLGTASPTKRASTATTMTISRSVKPVSDGRLTILLKVPRFDIRIPLLTALDTVLTVGDDIEIAVQTG